MIDPRLQIREVLQDPDAVPFAVYADEVVERHAMDSGAGLFARAGTHVWRVSGGDAIDYLHRMLTQDVKGIATPGARRACLLNIKGRVLADIVVWRVEDACLLSLDGSYDQALPVLEKFVIADDVEFEDVTAAYARLALVGPRVEAALAMFDIVIPEKDRCVSWGDETDRCHMAWVPHGDRVRYELLAKRGGVGSTLDALFGHDVLPVGARAFEHERIRVRDPGHGELDERILFNESQLDDAVSWDKGCYPGQEPVIMARHRGRPPNLLVGLRGDGRCPPVDSQLLAQGRPVGRITSLAPDGADGWIGLGYVRTAFADDPTPMQQPEGTCTLRG